MNTDQLTISLPAIKLNITRQEAYKGPFRERVSEEKYWQQSIQIYCKEGKLEDSGFVQVNDYTDMCKMIRVLPKHKQHLHAFDRWEHYGLSFFKTEKINIRDLRTGNFVKECSEVPAGMGHNDLEKNEEYIYSEVLLETLNEYSETNTPDIVLQNRKQFAEIKKTSEWCECKLFEYLDITDAFNDGRINKEDKNKMLNSLTCDCKIDPPKPEPTESELIQRAQYKVKALAEIAEVFIIKALTEAKVSLETKLYSFEDPHSGLAVISKEINQALKELEQLFIERQRGQDGPEIEKVFIEVERITREISKRL